MNKFITMKGLINIKNHRSFAQIFLLIFVSVIVSTSCTISWVAEYNNSIANQIEVVSKQVDKFYLMMLETTTIENDQRAYPKFAEQYIDIEVELKSLLQKNKRRDKNQESIEINKRILNKWLEYKAIHKKQNQLTNSDIEANKMNLENMMNTFRVAEDVKKRIK